LTIGAAKGTGATRAASATFNSIHRERLDKKKGGMVAL
jgi:hypothetical protein